MISFIISRIVILVFGNLYPAYASYKAVKLKNVREYVKWMMYWIVFAFFTCVEIVTDVFLSWFPFYYEIKILLVIWLLSPVTKGSSFLYRKFVHPILSDKEQEIDEYITKAKEQSYKQVLELGSNGVNALMQTARKNLNPIAGSIVQSLSDSVIHKALGGVQQSQSSQFNACEPYSDDELEYEAPQEVEQPAPPKRGGKAAATKPKGRPGVRKTSRKH